MKLSFKKGWAIYIPGHANRTIEKAHGKIIELRKEKTSLIEDVTFLPPLLGPSKEEQLIIIDEKIKQWEEEIKLWSGKLDPSRNKIVWSLLVPIVTSTAVSVILYYLLGDN